MGLCAGAASAGPCGPWPARARSTRSSRGWPSTPREPPSRQRGGRRAGRGRPRRRREPLLAPPQPGCRRGGGGRLRRAPHGAAPSRPGVAAAASGPPAATARRPGVGARDHQRAEPPGAGRAQPSVPPRCTTRSTRTRRRATGSTHAGTSRRRRHHQPCCCSPLGRWPARTSRARSPSARRWAAPTGSSGRPRTATGPSSSAWWHGTVPRAAGRARGRLLHRRRLRRL